MDPTIENSLSAGTEIGSAEDANTRGQPAPGPVSYSELFPSLEGSAKPINRSHGPRIRVSNARKNKSLVIVDIPKEEQRYPERTSSRRKYDSPVEKVLLDIATKARVKITHEYNRKTGSLIVKIDGKPEELSNVKKQVLSRLQTQASIEVDIPREHHRFIIGPEGSNLKKLSEKYSVRISMPKQSDFKNIIITGTVADCQKAAEELQFISFERAKLDNRKLNIPKAYHPLVAGPGNATLKRITEQTGVKVHMPPPAVSKNEISVSGEREAVAKACAELEGIYNHMLETCGELTAQVPRTQHRYLIGLKGANLREINEKTGVVVEVPHVDKQDDTIILRGDRNNLVQALALVYEFSNKMVMKKLSVPNWLHKHVIGKGGENVRKLREEKPSVHVQFPQEGDDIEIEGPPDDVDVVRNSLRELSDELGSTLTFTEVSVEPKFHPFIIGQGGNNIREIRAKSGANIDFPANDSGSDKIRIEGTQDAVQKASTLVTEMATKLRNQRTCEISVPAEMHSNIIGARGEELKKLLAGRNSVNLNFPDRSANSDVVLIRGQKEEVEAVIAAIKDLVKGIEAKNYSENVHVFRKFHSEIIGKGGENIKKIRTATNTRINVPKLEDESDILTLTGLKEDVQKAKQMILDLQQKVGKIVTEEIQIDPKYHPTIRGTQNRVQQSLEAELSVQITIPTAKEKSSTIKLHGPAESVQEAKKTLSRLACDESLNSTTLEFTSPQRFHRNLIGQHSSGLNKLVEESGVIRLIFSPINAKKDRDLVIAIGSKQACEKAKQLIADRVTELEKVVTQKMQIDPKHYPALRSRQFIKNLADDHVVNIRLPRDGDNSGSPSDEVIIRGSRDNVSQVMDILKEKVDQLEKSVTEELTVKPSDIPSIMGSRASNLQKICSDFSVDIDVPNRESRTGDEPVVIKITGLPDHCSGALDGLRALIPIQDTIAVPRELHRFMLTDKENGIRAIQSKVKARIDIPSADSDSSDIIIQGTPSQVAAAKAAITTNLCIFEDALKKNFSMTIDVDPEFHPDLIGNRGSKITSFRNKFDVKVDFPRKDGSRDLEPNKIRLIGYEDKCKECADEILAFVNDLKSHVIKEVDIHHAIHGKIIGSRGSGVRTLQDKYKVRITFPRDKNEDTLTVIGPEDKVDECITELFDIQEENDDLIEDFNEADRRKPSQSTQQRQKPKREPFKVAQAPWVNNEFPPAQGDEVQQASAPRQPLLGAWAGRK